MSSLLQHHRGVGRDGKVQLLAYLVKKGPKWEKYNGPTAYRPSPDSTTFTEPVEVDAGKHPRLWEFYRKPKGMWGNWVVFRWSNEEHVPDLSVPIMLFEMPRDAKRLSEEESIAHWMS